jgi:UDP-N-acetyl-D-glucosamine dehydrogenase
MAEENALDLSAKIRAKSTVVAVCGLGYVGLPLLAAFHRAGIATLGYDVDPKKIDLLKRGENYLKHLGESFAADLNRGASFDATDDPGRLAEADVVISCVPTPLGKHLEPDLTFVEKTAEDIARSLRQGQLVVLESTTYPGTTREVVLPRLTAGGLVCGRDFYLAYSPEREDPGRKDFTTRSIPKLVGGIDPVSGELAASLYRTAFDKVILVSSAEVAESAKLLENIYRSVNIALVNEMKMVLQAMGIDIWEVIAAAGSKPFGFQVFYPGPGLGGHCIPIDPYYLTWKAREFGMSTRFIELAGEVNHRMPHYVVDRAALALNNAGKAVKNSRILVLGLAYKPDVDDVRESPSFEIIELLEGLGASVDYHDPHVPATHKMRRHDLGLVSIELTPAALASYDCVVIATHHSVYDWQMIADHSKLIVDTRNALANVQGRRNHIVGA